MLSKGSSIYSTARSSKVEHGFHTVLRGAGELMINESSWAGA